MARVFVKGDGDIARDVRSLVRADPNLILSDGPTFARFTVEIRHDALPIGSVIAVCTGPRISGTELRLIQAIATKCQQALVDCGAGVADEHHVIVDVPSKLLEHAQVDLAVAIYTGLLTVAHVTQRAPWWKRLFRTDGAA